MLAPRHVRRTRWSAEDDAKLTRGASAGAQISKIAEALGRTVAAVQTRMTKLGLRRNAAAADAITDAEA
jgi:Fe2+ transport system protein FeoA